MVSHVEVPGPIAQVGQEIAPVVVIGPPAIGVVVVIELTEPVGGVAHLKPHVCVESATRMSVFGPTASFPVVFVPVPQSRSPFVQVFVPVPPFVGWARSLDLNLGH
jgi:hypothetical protein